MIFWKIVQLSALSECVDNLLVSHIRSGAINDLSKRRCWSKYTSADRQGCWIICQNCWCTRKCIGNDVLLASQPFYLKWLVYDFLTKPDNPFVIDLIQVFRKYSNERSVISDNFEVFYPFKKRRCIFESPKQWLLVPTQVLNNYFLLRKENEIRIESPWPYHFCIAWGQNPIHLNEKHLWQV